MTSTQANTTNQTLNSWIKEIEALCKPNAIHICDGSQEEYDSLCEELVEAGTFIRLNPELRPGCFLSRSDPRDVARVAHLTGFHPVIGGTGI